MLFLLLDEIPQQTELVVFHWQVALVVWLTDTAVALASLQGLFSVQLPYQQSHTVHRQACKIKIAQYYSVHYHADGLTNFACTSLHITYLLHHDRYGNL